MILRLNLTTETSLNSNKTSNMFTTLLQMWLLYLHFSNHGYNPEKGWYKALEQATGHYLMGCCDSTNQVGVCVSVQGIFFSQKMPGALPLFSS